MNEENHPVAKNEEYWEEKISVESATLLVLSTIDSIATVWHANQNSFERLRMEWSDLLSVEGTIDHENKLLITTKVANRKGISNPLVNSLYRRMVNSPYYTAEIIIIDPTIGKV